MSAGAIPGIGDLLSQAKDIVMKRWKFFLILSVIPSLFSFLGTLLGMNNSAMSAGLLFLFLLLQIVTGVLSYAAIIMGLDNPAMTDWMAGYKQAKSKFWTLVWVSILVSIVVGVGLILLVIPGIYLAIIFGFAPFVIILEGVRGWKAAERSRDLVKGHWWAVFGRLLVLQIIITVIVMVLGGIVGGLRSNILIAIVSFILPTILWPFYFAYMYLVYKALKK